MEDKDLIKLDLDPTIFDAELSQLMEERFEFAQRIAADNPLMSIVSSMSVLECFFIGIANSRKEEAFTYNNELDSNNREKGKLDKWRMDHLINIVNRMGFINKATCKICLEFNTKRNRVHIYQQYLDKKEEYKQTDIVDATIALTMVKSVISNVNAKFNLRNTSKCITLLPSKKLLLSRLVLIGSFDSGNKNDLNAIKRITNCNYEECYNFIENLRTIPDYGIEKKQGVYYFIERFALWRQLEEIAKDESYTNYKTVVINSLLSSQDNKTSYQLNKGLAQGLQLLGKNNSAVKEICVKLLRQNGEYTPYSRPADVDVWNKLQRYIENIAIAVPETFLYTFEECQKYNHEIIQNILSSDYPYREKTVRSIFNSLESLSLDEHYFSRACRILLNAQQAKIGDSDWLNSILFSLIKISRLLISSKRTNSIQSLVSLCKETRFNLSCDLFYFILDRIKRDVDNNSDLIQIILNELVKLSIGPDAYIKLAEYSPLMEQECFNNFSDAVSHCIFSQDQKFQLIDNINRSCKLCSKCNEELLHTIELFVKSFETNEFVRLAHELFDDAFQLNDADNLRKQQQFLEELLRKNDYRSIVMLSNTIHNYFKLTETLFKSANEDNLKAIDRSIYPLANNRNQYRMGFDALYSRRRFQQNGMSWINELNISIWSQNEIISLFQLLPITAELLAFVNAQSDDFQSQYWKLIDYWHLSEHDINEPVYISLLKYNNVQAILKSFDYMNHNIEPPKLIWEQIITQVILNQSEISCNSDTLELILSHFDDKDRLGYEQQLFPLFHQLQQIPEHYSRSVMQSSSVFMDLFDRTDITKFNESEEYRHQYSDSYYVLSHLDGFPGLSNNILDEEVFNQWWTDVKVKYEHTERFNDLLGFIGEFIVNVPLSNDKMLYPSFLLQLLNHDSYESLRANYRCSLLNHNGGKIFSGMTVPQRIDKCNELKNQFETSSSSYPIFAKVFDDLANSYKNDSLYDLEMNSTYDVIQRFENQTMTNQE